MEPQEKPQKPNHHRRTDGLPRFMRNRRLTSRRTLWNCGIQNFKMKGSFWRQLHNIIFSQYPRMRFQTTVR
eukprot:7290076-Pyramimonas_sp.AAC.1